MPVTVKEKLGGPTRFKQSFHEASKLSLRDITINHNTGPCCLLTLYGLFRRERNGNILNKNEYIHLARRKGILVFKGIHSVRTKIREDWHFFQLAVVADTDVSLLISPRATTEGVNRNDPIFSSRF